MPTYNFKSICKVPGVKDFIDIILSRTQRKTPTVVRRTWKISRIREFYIRKVRFTQQNYHDKLSQIVDEFPKLDELHPFYSSLINVLYSRDHYKLALGHINTARTLIDNLGKDYLRLLKLGDSLYRCKQLKRAALGRMCTLMKKLGPSLGYLEEVRQHLARLPSIDPSTRSLIITGYPNVGKSSFINKISRAQVDVQPYAFTTKSIFVGHFDYRYLRWQVLDTPGILDHPLEERNTIEMQAITALAHLQSCVLFFVDISESCGYTIKQQVDLFHSIKPLFMNKPILLVANKTDLKKMEDLDSENKALIESMRTDRNVKLVPMSNVNETNIHVVKTAACDLLLQHRYERKTKKMANRLEEIASRIHVARPPKRDNKERPITIPDSVAARRRGDAMEVEKRKTEKEIELENGGPGIYSVDTRKYWDLENPDWKYDNIPEIMDGKNIADFVDPDIDRKLQELELEEERLAELAENEDAMMDFEDLTEEQKELVGRIRVEKSKRVMENRSKQTTTNRPKLPRRASIRAKPMDKVASHLESIGVDPTKLRARSRSKSALLGKRTRSKSRDPSVVTSATVRERSTTRPDGLGSETLKKKAKKVEHKQQRIANLQARAGPGDRRYYDQMPKHLFTGKRGIGKTDRR